MNFYKKYLIGRWCAKIKKINTLENLKVDALTLQLFLSKGQRTYK
jgi:hypothetical protein